MSFFLQPKVSPLEEFPGLYLPGPQGRSFHPVAVGDVYSHYRVIRKLGHGAVSTVWLAEDVNTERAVALKVLANNADRREVDILKRIKESSSKDPAAAAFVLCLLDYFEHSGPNGTHLCLVLELMWQDVLGFLEGYRDLGVELRYPLVRKISKQLVQGLDFIHSCGILHNDFHPKNFLLGFGFTPLTVRELLARDKAFSIYGDPTEACWEAESDGVKIRMYQSQPICFFSDGDPLPLQDLVIKVADFGKAAFLDESVENRLVNGAGAKSFNAPEIILNQPWDCPADIWSLGASIYEMMTSAPLFNAGWRSNEKIILSMIEACGPLPNDLHELAGVDALQEKHHHRGIPYQEGLQKRLFFELPELSGAQNRLLADCLGSMLEMDAMERVSLPDLLCHRWWREPEVGDLSYHCKCGTLATMSKLDLELPTAIGVGNLSVKDADL